MLFDTTPFLSYVSDSSSHLANVAVFLMWRFLPTCRTFHRVFNPPLCGSFLLCGKYVTWPVPKTGFSTPRTDFQQTQARYSHSASSSCIVYWFRSRSEQFTNWPLITKTSFLVEKPVFGTNKPCIRTQHIQLISHTEFGWNRKKLKNRPLMTKTGFSTPKTGFQQQQTTDSYSAHSSSIAYRIWSESEKVQNWPLMTKTGFSA